MYPSIIAKAYMAHQARRALRSASRPEESQRQCLAWLLRHGARTEWGRMHGLDKVSTPEQYAAQVPVSEYEAFRPLVMRMVQGERDVLWPGRTRRFAQSSGTSGGKSKYIPITDHSLQRCHYAGATQSVALYLRAYPDSRVFDGKAFMLGGSYANELDLPPGVCVGDLSATLIDQVNPLVARLRVPAKDIALMADWRQKLPALVAASVREPRITNLSGVPSWFLTVLKQVLAATGAQTVQQVWPHLEVFFHGGIAFGPYRDEYAKIMSPQMRYWENYNASEGFFAAQLNPGQRGMLLMLDTGTYYEFVPLSQVDEPNPQALTAWQVEPGKTYALVITSCNGLWRYAIGDTVRVESVEPLTITIAGRTHSYINAFGEELMVYNADAAIERACRIEGCTIANYTAAPVYAADGRKGRHQWLIEWVAPPKDLERFADTLDRELQRENSDYQAKRQGSLFLDRLQVVTVPEGMFDRWLATTGKLGGQRKIPRLSNDRRIADALLQMTANT